MRYLKIFMIVIVVALIILRLCLPHILLRYAERTINKIPEYRVKIQDVDVHLYRGSYTIKGIDLKKITKNIPAPFFSAKSIDLSIEWSALFHGRVVAKIIAYSPVLNFVTDPKGNNEQLSINDEWKEAVKELFPVNINRLETINGSIHYKSFTSKPPFDLYLKDVHLIIENMQKITNDENLSSTFQMTAKSKRGGNLDVKGKFNPFTTMPTFYLTADLKKLNLLDTNNYLDQLMAIKVKKGIFSLYIELAAAKGKITGYAKPFIKDLEITSPNPANPIQDVYAGFVELVSKIVTNSKQQTIATKIELNGNIKDPHANVFSIIGFMLGHAFVHALAPQIDHNVRMIDVYHEF